MDELLMLLGVDRHCPDCAAVTIFLPVLDPALDPALDIEDEWICTACDGALVVPALAA